MNEQEKIEIVSKELSDALEKLVSIDGLQDDFPLFGYVLDYVLSASMRLGGYSVSEILRILVEVDETVNDETDGA